MSTTSVQQAKKAGQAPKAKGALESIRKEEIQDMMHEARAILAKEGVGRRSAQKARHQAKLRWNSQRKQHPYRQLPFVGLHRNEGNAGGWTVPATGGYLGGLETGKAMGFVFLKFLRENPGSRHTLAWTVEGFMNRFTQEEGARMSELPLSSRSTSSESLRGQYIGFFGILGEWLDAAAQHLGGNLDNASNQQLLNKANAGLAFDEEAVMAVVRAKEVEA